MRTSQVARIHAPKPSLPAGQVTEAVIAGHVLNQMTELGRPQ